MTIDFGNMEVTVNLDRSPLGVMVVMQVKYLLGIYFILNDMISSEVTCCTYYQRKKCSSNIQFPFDSYLKALRESIMKKTNIYMSKSANIFSPLLLLLILKK